MSSTLEGTYVSSDVGEILTFTGTGWTRTLDSNTDRNVTDGTGSINGNTYNGRSNIRNENIDFTIIDANTIRAPSGRTYIRRLTIGTSCQRTT
jgi:hypothetical protein